jgi:molecular chaperone DnaK (HSP70)
LIDSALAASFFLRPKATEKPILLCELRNDVVQASLIRVDASERAVISVACAQIAEKERLSTAMSDHLRSAMGNANSNRSSEDMIDESVKGEAKEWIESMFESPIACWIYRRVILGKMVECELSNERLSALGEVYFQKAAGCLSACLEQADLSWDDIESVSFFGEYAELTKVVADCACYASIPLPIDSPAGARYAVAYGAAIFARDAAQGIHVHLVPIATHDISLRTRATKDARFTRLSLIEEGAQLPFKVVHTLKTSRIDQERLVLEVVEGNDTTSTVVKVVEFGPLVPQSERHPIEVRFVLNDQGLLNIIARDGVTKRPIATCPPRSDVCS